MTVANKKISIILLLVAFALVSLLVIAMSKGVPDDSEANSLTETEQYFINQVAMQTYERIDSQPIEGIEKSMYLQAYPGLEDDDFTDVETLGDTNQADVQTTADASITNAGLAKLLENVADRLDLATESPDDIDALLVTISQSTSGSDADTATSSVPTSEGNEEAATSSVGDDDIADSCIAAGGDWLGEHNECEYASQDWCADAGGDFDDCTSACRNDPDAEICTMQCVPVCAFTDTEQ